MPSRFKSLELLKILNNLPENKAGKKPPGGNHDFDPAMLLMRSWQAERMKTTYADLIADPQYRLAALFLLNDIYNPHEYGVREGEVEDLRDFLSRFLPGSTLRMLDEAIALYRLTDALDVTLLHVLVNRLGMRDELDEDLYAEGYRACDNYDQRLEQIETMVGLLKEALAGSRNPMVGMALRLAHKPAQAAGWGDLFDFLERGYAATKSLPTSNEFIKIIQTRETRILNQIYAGAPNPFAV
jgi:hypothetical protein